MVVSKVRNLSGSDRSLSSESHALPEFFTNDRFTLAGVRELMLEADQRTIPVNYFSSNIYPTGVIWGLICIAIRVWLSKELNPRSQLSEAN